MDEKKGRTVARARGLKVAGTLAVILDGDARQLFDSLNALDRLQHTNFYASIELLQAIRLRMKKSKP